MRFKLVSRRELTLALGNMHPLYWSDLLLGIQDIRVGPGFLGMGVKVTGRLPVYWWDWKSWPPGRAEQIVAEVVRMSTNQAAGLLFVMQRVDAPPYVPTAREWKTLTSHLPASVLSESPASPKAVPTTGSTP